MSAPTLKDRFWIKVSKTGKSKCWEWTASRNKKGYGRFRFEKGFVLAHRMAYLLSTGEIGEFHVCHTCDNPPCCNPAHLFLGTAGDNAADRNRKGRAKGANGATSRADVLDIKRLMQEGAKDVDICATFGLASSTVSMIRTGKRHASALIQSAKRGQGAA